MAPQSSFKVTKSRKSLSKKPKLATIAGDNPSSYGLATNAVNQNDPVTVNYEIGHARSSYTHSNTFIHLNGVYFTLEECQLICFLREMSADVDLVSEIIKHERKSPEPVNCAGLYEYIWNANPSAMTGQVILPLLADVGAARAKAQTAYTKWMEYMTAVVWKSISLLFLA